jgi:hypothetical protein
VEQGIASIEDVDKRSLMVQACDGHCSGHFLICTSPGELAASSMYWSILGPATESWWRDLGKVTLNEKLKRMIARGELKNWAAWILATSPVGRTTHC